MTIDLENIHPEQGLGEELFLAVSSLVPIINVDVLVYNSKGQFLLTMRNDLHCGKGWHVPGGCIQFKETCEERVRKVALKELGIKELTIGKEPAKVFEIIEHEQRPIKNQNERAHFITLLYMCKVDDGYQIDNGGLTEDDSGYIRWFNHLLDNLLKIQNCYREIIK